MPAVVLRGAPGWLQVIHGTNVSNRVRGRRTRPSAHRAAFTGLLDDLPDPTHAEIVRDTLLGAPSRALREGSRAAVKTAVGATLGRDGLDRVKLLRARVGRFSGHDDGDQVAREVPAATGEGDRDAVTRHSS